jgi:hypothetical protein
MKEFNAIALFRLSVLGTLVSRERLARGELQSLIRELARKEYAIPGSNRRFLSEKAIEAWYYAWRAHGVGGLVPQPRNGMRFFITVVRVKSAKRAACRIRGHDFEVPYELSGKTVRLVIDPQVQQVVGVEDEDGNSRGAATPPDARANCRRRRRKPDAVNTASASVTNTTPAATGLINTYN